MSHLLDALLWLDIQVLRVLTLGRGRLGETISAAAWRMKLAGRWHGATAVALIDALFAPWQKNHCQNAYLSQSEIYQHE